jgi:cytochrome c biogenesis protein CcdA
VISATGYILFYALVAAASPLVLTATLVVIRSERPRTNGIAFLAGFLLGTTLAVTLALILGQAAVERLDSHETIAGVLAMVLGAALVTAGVRKRRNPSQSDTQTGRGSALMARLRHVRPGEALSVAVLLGIGGPKRLLLTVLAMASLSQADLRDLANLTLVVLYVAVATLAVWVPVGIVLVGGRRAAMFLSRGESWLKTNATLLYVWLTLGIGVALVIDGFFRLR